MILVVLLYPDGQRRQVILAVVPVTGDTIRLRGESRALVVEHRLLMEGGHTASEAEPIALISVRPAAP